MGSQPAFALRHLGLKTALVLELGEDNCRANAFLDGKPQGDTKEVRFLILFNLEVISQSCLA